MTFFKIPKRMNKLLISASHESDAINPDAFPPPDDVTVQREDSLFSWSKSPFSNTILMENSTFVNLKFNQIKN